ncbi:hypothetical protein SUGI_0315520 [Cryptomeria japonica]|uniref:uncharacterized protein LOC131070032 n=1 Tax=Cryptomeria japonica TaxID=3369 RepID=UPI002408BB3C|nr:uncharacterized protein LOC131070032 [Cryptomeria japonica]GLJ17957.1 hypothetical protein SUGI_0315520 [Cryptomeria japonica]
MVLPLRPSKFYGRSLPRPRVYNDLKFNSERVDPPMGVTTPLLSWAKDARWSVGGLSYERKRMAGKIEGSKKRLIDEPENGTAKQIRDTKKRKMMQEEPEQGEKGGNTKSKLFSSPKLKVFNSPRPAQIFKPKWATEEDNGDGPLVVPDSIKRPAKKRSPKVRIQARNLGDFSEADTKGAHFTKGISSIVGQKRPRGQSAAQCALKRQAMGITQVYDYVSVPDKIMQMPVKRVSPRRRGKENKEGADSGSPAGFEPRSPASIERPNRRSSRALSYSPGPFSRGIKRVILSP